MRHYTASHFRARETATSDIVIIDNNFITPYAISRLLARHPDLNVAGHACESVEALSLCRKLLPDMVIIDPHLPGLDGLSIITQLRRILPGLRVLVYGFEHRHLSVLDYINARVNGIVLKNSPLATLVTAINHIASGHEFMDARLSPAGADNVPTPDARHTPIALPHLSPRERQILKMIVEGGKNKDIARILSISVKTIESHRLNMMRKLNAHSVLDLIRWAQRFNISH